MADVSIIIVSYNQFTLLSKCIQSILEHERETEFEIIIVDNCSTEDKMKTIPDISNRINMIFLDKNEGFGRANNRAVSLCQKSNYLLFINPDTRLTMPLLQPFIHYMKTHSDVLMMGPKLLNQDGSLQHSTHGFPSLSKELIRLVPGVKSILSSKQLGRFFFRLIGKNIGSNLFARYMSYNNKVSEVDELTGACFFMRTQDFQKMGGFDPTYFMYLEEADLCFRIRKGGGKIIFIPKISVIHELHGSRTDMALSEIVALHRHRTKSLFFFFKKHYGNSTLILGRVLFACILCLRIFFGAILTLFKEEHRTQLLKDKVFFKQCIEG